MQWTICQETITIDPSCVTIEFIRKDNHVAIELRLWDTPYEARHKEKAWQEYGRLVLTGPHNSEQVKTCWQQAAMGFSSSLKDERSSQ